VAGSSRPATPQQERTMSDKIKDMPEKKLDKSAAETVKGGKTNIKLGGN
jgi:hypothetical protein